MKNGYTAVYDWETHELLCESSSREKAYSNVNRKILDGGGVCKRVIVVEWEYGKPIRKEAMFFPYAYTPTRLDMLIDKVFGT